VRLFIESTSGAGARFTIRLPFTLAITQALILRVHDELFALPMATVEGVARLTRSEIQRHLDEEQLDVRVRRQRLIGSSTWALFVGSGPSAAAGERRASLPVDPRTRGRTFHGARHHGRADRQPRDRRQARWSADRGRSAASPVRPSSATAAS
jgi:hypothetical protein